MSVASPTSSNSGEFYSQVNHWLKNPFQPILSEAVGNLSLPSPNLLPLLPSSFSSPCLPRADLSVRRRWQYFLFSFPFPLSDNNLLDWLPIAVFLSDACFRLSIELVSSDQCPSYHSWLLLQDKCNSMQYNSINAMQKQFTQLTKLPQQWPYIYDGATQPQQMSLFTFDILNRRSPPPQLLDTTEEQTSPHHRLNQVCLWNNLLFDNSWNNFNSNEIWGNAKETSLGANLQKNKNSQNFEKKAN